MSFIYSLLCMRFIYSLSCLVFDESTADFNQSNIQGIQARNMPGYRLHNGNFIFLWRNVDYWNMVLTQNNGTQIKGGYVKDPGNTWKDPNTWTSSTIYSISKFKGGMLKMILI